jgi:hypothetical protein
VDHPIVELLGNHGKPQPLCDYSHYVEEFISSKKWPTLVEVTFNNKFS